MPEEKSQTSCKAGVNLTKTLIAWRNLFIPAEEVVLENTSQALASLQILRLDRERISCISNLQGLEQLHSIYLQQNQIEKIENLSCLPNLKFLSLAGNRIHKVENLLALQKLKFLDLSHNCIETLDTDELPQSLVILDLTGNKCRSHIGYRESVLAALPHLIELDAQDVPRQKAPFPKREEEEDSEDSDEEDFPELSSLLSTEKDFFIDLHNELTSRSARRRGQAMSEHEARLEELKERQQLQERLLQTSQGSPATMLHLSEPTSPAPEDTTLQTEQHAASKPLLKTTNATFHVGSSAPKGKAEGGSRTKLKTLKGEVSSASKTGSKVVKK
ncbi:leucine-rich repeat-containing protein 46 [Hemicordylus capensis]|uniref:leucine-rich repeat-containing protein 46 n=1 Tax=Hemicordylus capensis TaxID=884348 RepID=UPI0023033F52|nr:leucine-rich repeat-containing protein 46 [Hemicordylus capensis]